MSRLVCVSYLAPRQSQTETKQESFVKGLEARKVTNSINYYRKQIVWAFPVSSQSSVIEPDGRICIQIYVMMTY